MNRASGSKHRRSLGWGYKRAGMLNRLNQNFKYNHVVSIIQWTLTVIGRKIEFSPLK